MLYNHLPKLIRKAIGCLVFLITTVPSLGQIQAAFTSNVVSGCAPLTVQFVNQSQNATSYYWDFGNGTISQVANPVVVFNTSGSFTVKLVANGNTRVDSVIRTSYIAVFAKPVIQFNASITATCPGNSIQFQNQTSAFDSCIWDFGDGVTSTLSSPAHAYTGGGTFTVSLMAYRNGCSATLSKQNYISVTPQPSVTAQVDTTTACSTSKAFHFSVSNTITGTYTWNFGDGHSASGYNVQHSYAQAGNYTVTLDITTPNGCNFHYSYPNWVTVINNIVPVITATGTSGCSPLSEVFAVSPQGITSILWDFGNGATANTFVAQTDFLTAGTYSVKAMVTYPNGCVLPTAIKTVTVDPSPVSQFTSNQTGGCTPLSIQFTQTIEPGVNYKWLFDDGDSSLSTNPSHVYNITGNPDPSLTAVGLNGCKSTSKLPYGLLVNGVTADFTADKASGCNPLSVNFTNLSQGAQQTFWNFGNGDTSSAFNPLYVYQQQGTYAVQLIAKNNSGCSDTLLKSGYMHVGSSTNNFANGTPVSGCAPFTFSLSDSSGSTSWLWNFGDGTTSGSQNPTHTFFQPGTYVVSLQTQSNGNGCSQFIPNFRTFIIGGGNAAFSYTQTLCPPYIGYFTDSSTNAVTWHWNFGDGNTSTVQNPIHAYQNSGGFHVSLSITTSDGCVATSTHQYAMNFGLLSGNATSKCQDSIAPYDVQFFANSSGATSWLWTFGDGDSSSLENPLHSYANAGPFTLTLTVANDSCSHTYVFPPTDFGTGGNEFNEPSDSTIQSSNYDGCAPLTLTFHNPMLNAVSWHWDFGDGNTSSDENPEHTFTQAGTFDMMLWVTYADGTMDTIYTPAAVKVAGTTAHFSVSSVNSCNGVNIQLLTDTAHITNYLWDFGDGTSDTSASPAHIYTGTNNYIISLSTTDDIGCAANASSSFYAEYSSPIQVSNKRVCADDSVLFSVNNINYTKYLWQFGDGDTASGNTVYHTYSDSGFYDVSLTVTDASGCLNTFTYSNAVEVSKPIADFTVDTPETNCTWIKFIFENTSTGSDLYHWTFGDGTSSTQQDYTKFYYYTMPKGYYDVTLTATRNGCSSTKTLTNTVYVPDYYADFSYTRSTGCLPITISITDSSNDVNKWQWSFGDGDSAFTASPTHTFDTIPSGKIKLTTTDIYGCKKIIEKDNVSLPEAHFALSDSAGCAPFTVQYTDLSLNSTQWNWAFGDGQSASVQSPQHIYQANGNYSATLIVSDNYGCRDTLHTDSLVSVTSPQVNLSMTTTGGCAPVIATFQNLSSSTQTYLWDFGDGSTSAQENPDHIYTNPGSYAVSLTGTDGAGCSATRSLNSTFIIPGPVAKFNFTGTSGCSPYTVSFNDSSSGASSHFWNFSDGDSSKLSSPAHTFDAAGIYEVTLIVNDINGCQSVYTHPQLITVSETPAASFVTDDSVVCVNSTVTLKNTSTHATSYHWDFGDGFSSSTPHPKHTYSAPGNYTLKLTASNNSCADSVIQVNRIKVVGTPVAAFTSDVQEGCDPLSVHFINQSTQNPDIDFAWDLGNGITSAAVQPQLVYDQPGYYTVSLIATNENVCSDTAVITNYIHAINSDPLHAPPLNYATVLNDHSTRVQWQNSTALNVSHYELYRSDNNGQSFKQIHSVTNGNNSSLNPSTTFIDTTANTLTQSYQYKVKVINNCNQAYDLDSSTIHATVYLKAKADTGQVSLQWTAYKGCDFDNYIIYRSEDGQNYDLIAQTPYSVQSYIDSTAYCSHLYSYRIETSGLCSNSFTSESNHAEATPVSLLETQATSITRSTVEENSFILTEWSEPAYRPEMITQYHLYRSSLADSGVFNLVATIPSTFTSYIDLDVDVNKESYQYKIEVENICGVRGGMNSLSKTILLNGELNSMEGSTLKWTPYEGWKEGVDYYEIQQQDKDGNWQTIRKVNGNVNEMEDN